MSPTDQPAVVDVHGIEANFRWWLNNYAADQLAGPLMGIVHDHIHPGAPTPGGDLAALRALLAPIDTERAEADRARYGPARYAALTTRQTYVRRGLMAATGAELVDEIQRRLQSPDPSTTAPP